MSTTVATEGIVLRGFSAGISTGAHSTHWRAHTTDCRYATGELTYPMTEMIKAYGEKTIRSMIAAGIVVPCGVCKPTLLVAGAES